MKELPSHPDMGVITIDRGNKQFVLTISKVTRDKDDNESRLPDEEEIFFQVYDVKRNYTNDVTHSLCKFKILC
jgi:hypothetical protein